MKDSISISLCMIVKDEAANLPSCLASVREVVDEMVVLDTGSTDATVAIAQSYGAQVYHFPWGHDFAQARNEALKYVHGAWVLVLDADEVLAPEIIPYLEEVVKEEQNLVVNLLRHELGAEDAPYSEISRLFRRHPQLYFTHPYHASIDESAIALLEEEPYWKIISIPLVALRHTGYQPGVIAQRQKLSTAKALMESYLAIHPEDAYTQNKLGALYLQIGEQEKGIKLLQQAIASPGIQAPLLFEINYHLGNAYTKLGDNNQAAAHYQAALEQQVMPQIKLPVYHNLGILLLDGGDLETAKSAFEIVLKIDPSFAQGYYHLGVALKLLDNYEAAIACYQQAISLQPNYPEAYQSLGVLLLLSGQIDSSMQAFSQAIDLHQPHNPEAAKRIEQELGSMGFDPARYS